MTNKHMENVISTKFNIISQRKMKIKNTIRYTLYSLGWLQSERQAISSDKEAIFFLTAIK